MKSYSFLNPPRCTFLVFSPMPINSLPAIEISLLAILLFYYTVPGVFSLQILRCKDELEVQSETIKRSFLSFSGLLESA